MKQNNSLPRVVFFGTPEFARFCLASLVNYGFPVVGVVTAPDRKAGRGKKLTSSAVKEFALRKNLRLLQPTNLKDPDFMDQLRQLNADLFAVVAFRMLPIGVWSIPPLGCINLHASLLPDYRGAAPINWVLINGEQKTGVTTFLIDEAIDSGALLMQKTQTIETEDTFETLHDKLLKLGAPLLCETLKKLSEHSVEGVQQVELQNPKMAPKLTTENTQLDWDSSTVALVNKIRGLNPYPGAWTFLYNNGIQSRVKLFIAMALKENHDLPPGKILIRNSEMLIATVDGFLNCLEIQLPNKKRMAVRALLNGYSFDTEAKML